MIPGWIAIGIGYMKIIPYTHTYKHTHIYIYNSIFGHGYSGHSYIVGTLPGTESFSIISSLNYPLIVATHFGYSGQLTGRIMIET